MSVLLCCPVHHHPNVSLLWCNWASTSEQITVKSFILQIKKMVNEALAQQGLKSASRRAKVKEELYDQMEEALEEQVGSCMWHCLLQIEILLQFFFANCQSNCIFLHCLSGHLRLGSCKVLHINLTS